MKIISTETLHLMREQYKPGTKVRLIKMDDPQAVPSGTIGEVFFVDDIGTIHVKWETGSSLGLVQEVDTFEIISD